MFARERYPWVVDRTMSGLPAEKAGILSGDVIVAVNETLTPTADLFVAEIKANPGKEISLTINRDGVELVKNMQITDEGTIGVQATRPEKILHSKSINYGFWASFPAGVQFGVDRLTNYVKSMKLVFSKEGVKQLGGFIAIGNIFPAEWNWLAFWSMTAFLSIILAFMNILPIPALDGGHVLFILYEIITGRKPSDKFLEHAQVVGMVLLIGLLLLANGNDVIRLFTK
jgi:regulator of sigma E protease